MGFLGFGSSCLGCCAGLGWWLGESFWPFPSPRPHPSPLPPSERGDLSVVGDVVVFVLALLVVWGFTASAGIPCDLVSLARVPLRFAKGRAPFVLRTFPPRVGGNLAHLPPRLPSPWPSPAVDGRFGG